jgi:hypothetical protein
MGIVKARQKEEHKSVFQHSKRLIFDFANIVVVQLL